MKRHSRATFVREESWRYKRVKSSWRSPRGKTSRVRRSKEGWPPVVKIGYSRPTAIRGLHPSGLREVIVRHARDLATLNPKTTVARIAHTIGENKRLLIIEEAERKEIRVLNPGPKKEHTGMEPSIEETATESKMPAENVRATSPKADSNVPNTGDRRKAR